MKEQANLLTPGAIWARTDKDLMGRRNTVLLVANGHLTGRKAQVNPPIVVYTNDEGDIYAVTADRFTSDREYWDMDATVLRNATALLTGETQVPDDEEEPEEDDGLVVHNDGDYDPTLDRPAPIAQTNDDDVVLEDESDVVPQQVIASVADEPPATVEDVQNLDHPQLTAVFLSNTDTYPELAPEQLEDFVVQYEQEPHLTEEGLGLRHKVLVMMGPGVTLDSLNNVFDPELPTYYSSFKMNNVVVQWDSYLGAWPVLSTDGVYASLVFTTRPQEGVVHEVTEYGVEEEPGAEEVVDEQAPIIVPATNLAPIDPPAPQIMQYTPEQLAAIHAELMAREAAMLAAAQTPVQQQPLNIVATPATETVPQTPVLIPQLQVAPQDTTEVVTQVAPPVNLTGIVATAEATPALDILGDTALSTQPAPLVVTAS